MIKQKTSLLAILLLISLSGNIFLFFLLRQYDDSINFSSLKEQYPFLSSRAFMNHSDLITNFLPLRKQIHTIADPYKDTFAMYFEYLPTGTSVGIHEDSEFTPASLLKVPVVMAYYYKRERLGMDRDADVQIQKSQLDSHYGDLYKKGAGYTINLGDAVAYTLQQSDNTASLILADQFNDDDFAYVYEGLDIPMAVKDNSPIITAQQYTSVLKALYFASILNKEDSEHILDLLSRTRFKNMLPSGVPASVPVAHKIGLIDKEIYQDCGIVYVPHRSYSLCMISKSDKKTAQKRMQKISQTVYNYVAGYKN